MSGGKIVRAFRLADVGQAAEVCVVGDFNDWSPTAHPMTREDGEFVARIALEPGRTYRFRYLLDGRHWANDWAADDYVPNEFGGDDSVVDLTTVEPQATPTT
jgi:1,4-alpha-glucan branching enzyme